jgi:hypothetical protein
LAAGSDGAEPVRQLTVHCPSRPCSSSPTG